MACHSSASASCAQHLSSGPLLGKRHRKQHLIALVKCAFLCTCVQTYGRKKRERPQVLDEADDEVIPSPLYPIAECTPKPYKAGLMIC